MEHKLISVLRALVKDMAIDGSRSPWKARMSPQTMYDLRLGLQRSDVDYCSKLLLTSPIELNFPEGSLMVSCDHECPPDQIIIQECWVIDGP